MTALDGEPEAILVDASTTDPETGEPGFSISRQALEAGKSVVFASKGPLVAGFEELVSLADRHGGRIGLSAAVGTPLPSVETGLIGLQGSRVHGFHGCLNETSNRILRDMEDGVSYVDAVEGARRAGVLETDPRLDLEGWDTAFKVLILARTFWRTDITLDPTHVQGITEVSADDIERACAEGRRIKLLGFARHTESGDTELRVEPVWLDSNDPLHSLGSSEKGIVFDTDLMGSVVIRSGAAGPFDTAAAIVKDVLNIAAHPSWVAV
jgi:homoserine dehydrogenase